MITAIESIKSLGVFSNYKKTAEISDFKRFNLIFGWNGTGKTTLTSLFDSISARALDGKFPDADFVISLDDGSKIRSNNLQNSTLNIHTFNDSFVDANIDWDETVNSILLVAQEKIDEQKRLIANTQKRKQLVLDLQEQRNKLSTLEKARDRFLSDSARQIKEKFLILDTSDRHYFNYDKRKLDSLITTKEGILKATSGIVDEPTLDSLTKAARPNYKEHISPFEKKIDLQTVQKTVSRLHGLLNTSVEADTIQRLKDNPDIHKWVEDGIDIHKQHSSSVCEFCGKTLEHGLIDKLERHFNDALKALKDSLIQIKQIITGMSIELSDLPPVEKLYDEFHTSYNASRDDLLRNAASFNQAINKLIEDVEAKFDNPFRTDLCTFEFDSQLVNNFNTAAEKLNELVIRHNQKSGDFEGETRKAKQRLEMHYASTEISNFDYFQKLQEIHDVQGEIRKKEQQQNDLDKKITLLENQLSNESLGAKVFNQHLHKFLGRTDISLVFDKGKKGYKIIRPGNKPAQNLSEGEKTAIAFVYFITKIGEKANKIEDTIIVVDDPVSSFDANCIFHAYAFLKTKCCAPRQMFVLTHNFTFFRLIRDWLSGKNRKDKIASRFYVVDISPGEPRAAKLLDADETLTSYDSEYHYLFKKLYHYVNNDSLSVEEAFLTANLARKLLEAFLSFKFPRKRNDFRQLFENFGEDPVKKERLYRFVNKYSHSLALHIDETSTENVLGESTNVISEIFETMKELDETHYNEMVEVIGA